jgi:hypothetical protein
MSSAIAATFTLPDGTKLTVLDPPDEWLNKRFDGYIEYSALEPDHLARTCSALVGKYEPWGCALLSGGYCQVIYNKDLPAEVLEALIRHEVAHCHGWPRYHPMD